MIVRVQFSREAERVALEQERSGRQAFWLLTAAVALYALLGWVSQ